MFLLSRFRLLLMLLLVRNKLVLIGLLSLHIFSGTLLVHRTHTAKMIQFQQFQCLLIYLRRYLTVNETLLLNGKGFIV